MNATCTVDLSGGIPVCASCGEPLMEHEGMQALCRKSADQQAEIERLRRWEQYVETEIESSLRHFGDDRLADRFAESTSPIHQRLMMVFHCLILAAEAGGGET